METTVHIDKAERNEQFFHVHNLRTSPFGEWGVTVLFYAAMHYVDAVLAREPGLRADRRQPTNHADRNRGVAQSPTLSRIYNSYINLYNRSRDARYSQIAFPSGYVANLESRSFKPVRECARTVLRLP